ncbi:MAG TPA: pyridoxamine 5'-phosphate oxidase family protein [Candidatus Binataceae bacterium]|nr:pyridoxamine 5'-phosphate oxidase family protein [Candidatus Binataceae bacterium]
MDSEPTQPLKQTGRTRLKRFPARGRFERATINQILDTAVVAHLGFDYQGPAVLPMVFWRIGDHVYFHGSAKNRMFTALSSAPQCCFVASLVDAFVLARAALHHSVNYRSVVIYGPVQEITEAGPKLEALKGLIGRFYPDRWEHIRPPSPSEFASVRVFRLAIEEASAKIRSGFPTPYAEDFGIPVWAGVVPLEIGLGQPQLDPNSAPDTPPPDLGKLAKMLRGSNGA